jgi:malonyl CoA-acyl carrier protein transacylase
VRSLLLLCCVLCQALSKVEIRAPRVTVYSNVTAAPFPEDPQQIRALLARQLVEPVQVRMGGRQL